MRALLSWLAIIVLMTSFPVSADTAIITLNSNTANAILPTVRNLLDPGGTASAYQGKLIINSSAENIAEIKNILSTIDKPAKQLLISVKQDGAGNETNKGYRTEGEIQVNPHVTITHNSDGTITETKSSQSTIAIDSARINVINNKKNATDNASQRIRAMEGSPAYIYIGQQVPITNTTRDYQNNTLNRSVNYEDVNQGFYVTAYLIGDGKVQLDVNTENDKLSDNRRNTIDTQHASTTTSGYLGQWIALGGVNQDTTKNQDEYFSKNNQTKNWDNSIYIKVDVVE